MKYVVIYEMVPDDFFIWEVDVEGEVAEMLLRCHGRVVNFDDANEELDEFIGRFPEALGPNVKELYHRDQEDRVNDEPLSFVDGTQVVVCGFGM